jgi:C-terminal processing protease CtpA/Prc
MAAPGFMFRPEFMWRFTERSARRRATTPALRSLRDGRLALAARLLGISLLLSLGSAWGVAALDSAAPPAGDAALSKSRQDIRNREPAQAATTETNLPPLALLFHPLNGLANPGPLRGRVNAQLAACLDSTNPVVVHNALWMLAGVEGYTTRFIVPGLTNQVRQLMDGPDPKVSAQARRALNTLDPAWAASQTSYEEAFADLYQRLDREYPAFTLKGIDWSAVGREFLPRARTVKTHDEFGLLCLELVARLEDSHAYLMDGLAKVPVISTPRWDPGFACLIDDRDQPVIYHVDKGSSAERAGVRVGMTVWSLNGKPADQVLREIMVRASQYQGYSSQRYLRYHAAQWLGRQMAQGDAVALETASPDGRRHSFQLVATLGVRYLPRLPVPIPGIRDSGSVSWTSLSNQIGYLYVRRIDARLIPQLDQAEAELKAMRGLIVDVRGNSGGGFDAPSAHRSFSLTDTEEPERPRFKGPIALLIDARCISAGEGWASWFIAQKRARVFGETTAGASARKTVYTLKNGLFKVQYPVKAYTGFLDRPIERQGLEPDVPLRQNAHDLASGRDTVLEAAKRFLESLPGKGTAGPGSN